MTKPQEVISWGFFVKQCKIINMNIYAKLKWILGVLMIFLLIITTNLIDKENFKRINNSVTNIYEDRLIAKDIIFTIYKNINQKEHAILMADIAFFKVNNLKINNDINALLQKFEDTNLTLEEAQVFNTLKNQVIALNKIEINDLDDVNNDKIKMLNYIKTVKNTLYNLSKIQLKEGERQVSLSNKAFSTIELFTQIEIYILVFLAIIIQIVILYYPKK